MIKRTILALALATFVLSGQVYARSGGGHSSSHSSSGSHYSTGTHSSGKQSSTIPKSTGKSHSSGSTHASGGSGHTQSKSSHPRSDHAVGVPRDNKGHIARSEHARNDFKKSHPCPSTGKSSGSCPGYVIDHATPLKRGGKDDPSNMQWQTKEAAKAKDKVE
jgi:hypothetical protein